MGLAVTNIKRADRATTDSFAAFGVDLGEVAEFPNFPIAKIANKYITVKAARGHNYESCELALQQLKSKRFPLDLITTHRFALADTDKAIKAVGGSEGTIHVSLMPWD